MGMGMYKNHSSPLEQMGRDRAIWLPGFTIVDDEDQGQLFLLQSETLRSQLKTDEDGIEKNDGMPSHNSCPFAVSYSTVNKQSQNTRQMKST